MEPICHVGALRIAMSEKRKLPTTRELARKLGLKIVRPEQLRYARKRRGDGFIYLDARGRAIRDKRTLLRLKKLAVPPAYEDVMYAADSHAHLQAIGRDAAGRLQYRYHADWEKVRETRKAQRLAQFVEALPRIRRRVGRKLAEEEATKEFAVSAVIELVSNTSIRAGSEEYARERGTRGAATLLKSNVRVVDGRIVLHFKAKGGKDFNREVDAPRLIAAIEVLRRLPGRRLFQYMGEDRVHPVHAQDVNRYLQEIAEVAITLKDFRTLCASAAVLEELSKQEPAKSQAGRKRQVKEAVKNAAEELANTPTVCRKSYVHEAVVEAFENGVLEDYADALKNTRSPTKREAALAAVVAAAC
ncbi:MAG: DNA topoisomerase IB [Rhizomicrobium sp.]